MTLRRKKSLEDTEGVSEAVYQRRTDNSISQKESDKKRSYGV